MVDIAKFNLDERDAVREVVFRAFGDSEGQDEGRLIAALADQIIDAIADTGSLGFVASEGGTPVAAIFFTPLQFDNPVSVMLLSPVAVTTQRQGQGVGDQLIRAGLEVLARDGIEVVVTYGDPNYYGRFGFNQISVDDIQPPHELAMAQGWQAVSLGATNLPAVEGKARCIDAFDVPALW